MFWTTKPLVALAVITTLNSAVLAGFTVDTKTTHLTDGESTDTAKLSFEPDRLRIEGGASATIIIYRSDKQTLWNIHPDTKTYVEMNASTVAETTTRMKEAMARMDAQLSQLPPERRKNAEKLMAAMFASQVQPSMPNVTIKTSNTTRTIQSLNCRLLEVFQGKTKTGEYWVTDWKNIPISASDFTIFSEMGTFFSKILAPLQNNPVLKGIVKNPYQAFDKIDGFPILIRRLEDGKAVSETHFQNIQKTAHPNTHFDVPKGYKKKTQKAAPKPHQKTP